MSGHRPTEWSRWIVSLRLAVAPAWPAEPVGVAKPRPRAPSLFVHAAQTNKWTPSSAKARRLQSCGAMMRNPSCLISCSHSLPEGSLSVLVGRHGAMNPAGRVRCNM